MVANSAAKLVVAVAEAAAEAAVEASEASQTCYRHGLALSP